MEALAQALGITRQAYYQALKRQQAREAAEERILSLVRIIRAEQPRLGTRKVLHLLRPMLAQEGLSIGRDRLFALLRAHDLLVPRQRSSRRTTWGGRWRYANHLAGRRITAPNQAWVVDITYLRLEDGRFVYLFVVMDLYSRAIVGWALGDTLEAHHALQALRMALRQTDGSVAGLIHHSDHGVQYTSNPYQALLAEHGLVPSMGAVGNAYENAHAERVLGTLKQEYGVEGPWASWEQAQQAVRQAIRLYNTKRPHSALGLAVPWAVYLGQATAPAVEVKEVQDCPHHQT